MVSLDKLHLEVIDHIVDLLDVAEVVAVRLTCRSLARAGNYNRRHQQRYRHITVELTAHGLAEFANHTRAASMLLPCHLASLTLRGIARNKRGLDIDAAEDMHGHNIKAADIADDLEADRDVDLAPQDDLSQHARLLSDAFANLRQHSARGSLETLTLIVGQSIASARSGSEHSYRPSWRTVWAAAEHAFVTAMAALQTSGLVVTEHLDVMRSLACCAIPHAVFLEHLGAGTGKAWPAMPRKVSVRVSQRPRSAGAEIRARLKSLEFKEDAHAEKGVTPHEIVIPGRSVVEIAEASMWEPIQDWHQGQWDLHTMYAMRTQHPATRQLLRAVARRNTALAAVEDLDIAWLSLGYNGRDPYDGYKDAHDSHDEQGKAGSDTAAARRMALRGVTLASGDLEQTLQAARLEHMTLESVYLSTADPAALLQRLWTSSLSSFYLENVLIVDGIVYFGIPGEPPFAYLSRPHLGPVILEIRPEDSDVRATHPPPSTTVDYTWEFSPPEQSRWYEAPEYGKPDYGYDFLKKNKHMSVGRHNLY